jgi:hypothetical protein
MVTRRLHSEVSYGGADPRRFVAGLAAGLLASGSLMLLGFDGFGQDPESICRQRGTLAGNLPARTACVRDEPPAEGGRHRPHKHLGAPAVT